MNRLPFWNCTLISAVLFLLAPVAYDRAFCVVCLIVFLVVSGIIVYDDIKRIGLLNFNTLFLFSFFACTYVYPVFLVEQQSIIGEIVYSQIDTLDTLNKSSALCTFAICIYGLAYCLFRDKAYKNISLLIERNNVALLYKNSSFVVTILSFVCLFVTYNYWITYRGDEANINDPILEFYVMIMPMFLVSLALSYRPSKKVLNNFKMFLGKNKVIFISFILILFLLVLSGDRAPIISYSLVVISCITMFIKRIKTRYLIVMGLIGLFLMVVLRFTRASSDSLTSGGVNAALSRTTTALEEYGNPWDVLADYVGMSVELNVGMSLAQKDGLFYPTANFIRIVAAPIPFLPSSLIQHIYHRPLKETTSHYAINSYLNENGGTHSVIDIYLPFGIIGVIIVFFIFGWFVAKITNGLRNNLFCQIFYIFMLGQSLFIARNTITNLYRSVVFSYMIYFLLIKIKSKNYRILNNVAS